MVERKKIEQLKKIESRIQIKEARKEQEMAMVKASKNFVKEVAKRAGERVSTSRLGGDLPRIDEELNLQIEEIKTQIQPMPLELMSRFAKPIGRLIRLKH
jgi:hypothetical protein